jgi:acetyl-CoA carboxylase carboxyl transferase subunit beta
MREKNVIEFMSGIVDDFKLGDVGDYNESMFGVDINGAYSGIIADTRAKTGLKNAVAWGEGSVGKTPLVVAGSDFGFLGASMGCSEARTIVQAMHAATEKKLPMVWFVKSGGGRINEGVWSLLSISKILEARAVLRKESIPFICVAMNPTCAGSLVVAAQADILVGKESSSMGFHGPKVISMTEHFPLPAGFQKGEYAFRNGHVDILAKDDEIVTTLSGILKFFRKDAAAPFADSAKLPDIGNHAVSSSSAMDYVKKARDEKPDIRRLVSQVFESFVELHGDRINADDPAIFGGLGKIRGETAAIIGYDNTHGNIMDKIHREFNMAHPSGLRKAARLVELAGNLRLPLVTFTDSPGTYPDVKSEEDGIASALGDLILKMLGVQVPSIGFIVGEGGAMGALPFTMTDFLYMTDTSYYSLISPEGVASILYKDIKRADEAAAIMKITPPDMLEAGIIDGVIPVTPREGTLCGIIQSLIATHLFSPGHLSRNLEKRTRLKW